MSYERGNKCSQDPIANQTLTISMRPQLLQENKHTLLLQDFIYRELIHIAEKMHQLPTQILICAAWSAQGVTNKPWPHSNQLSFLLKAILLYELDQQRLVRTLKLNHALSRLQLKNLLDKSLISVSMAPEIKLGKNVVEKILLADKKRSKDRTSEYYRSPHQPSSFRY